MLGHARRDLVQAVRGLSRRPAFALGAILTLAVAIGANTAVFSVVDAVVLRPLPFPEPERLSFLTREGDVSIPDGVDWRAETRTFEEIALFLRQWNLDLTGDGDPERIYAAVVEPAYFRILGTAPLLGRRARRRRQRGRGRAGGRPERGLLAAPLRRRPRSSRPHSRPVGQGHARGGGDARRFRLPRRRGGPLGTGRDDRLLGADESRDEQLRRDRAAAAGRLDRGGPGGDRRDHDPPRAAVSGDERRQDRRADADARVRDGTRAPGAPRPARRRPPRRPRGERERGGAAPRPTRHPRRRARRPPGSRGRLSPPGRPGDGREPRARPRRLCPRGGARGLGQGRAPGDGAGEPAPGRHRRARRARARLHARPRPRRRPPRGEPARRPRVARGAGGAARGRGAGRRGRGGLRAGAHDARGRRGRARERAARRFSPPRAQLPAPAGRAARLRSAWSPHRRGRPARVTLRPAGAADAGRDRDHRAARGKPGRRVGRLGDDASPRSPRRRRGVDSHRRAHLRGRR